MTPSIAKVQALILEGLSLKEVQAALPNLKPTSVRTYYGIANAALSPEQRLQRDKARAGRPQQRATYHKKFQHREVLGAVHIRIGRKLLSARLAEQLTHGQFSDRYKFSNRVVLAAMEQGYHDFTVTEIYTIADIVNMTVEELLTPPNFGAPPE